MHVVSQFGRGVRKACVPAGLFTVLVIASAACEKVSPSARSVGFTTGPDGISTGYGAELSLCADEINRYRASVGRRPLARSASLEGFASISAERDGIAHIAHHYFTLTNGADMSSAETEILWWRGQAVRAVIQKGLAQMWKDGPSGEHYDILVGAYSEVGCGVFVNGSEVTVAQDFR